MRRSIAAAIAAAMLGAGNAISAGLQRSVEVAKITEDLMMRGSAQKPIPAKSLYKAWVRSGRKGPRTRRKKHQCKKPPRSWRRARVLKLRARKRSR